MNDLTVDTFRPHVGTVFTLDAGDQQVPLTLVVAEALGDQPATGRHPFSLEFDGPADPAYAQATVPLSHPVLGELLIFLVPLARDAEKTRYQSIFA
jgi:hypothetical protein